MFACKEYMHAAERYGIQRDHSYLEVCSANLELRVTTVLLAVLKLAPATRSPSDARSVL